MRGEIEQIYNDSKAFFPKFFADYIRHIDYLASGMDHNATNAFIATLLSARERGSFIYIIGNGGSAANASHFTEDVAMAAGGTESKPFRVLCLNDNVPYMTALGNDRGFENIFVDQLKNFYKEGDVLVTISCSGDSPNLLKAIDFVNERKGVTFGILGFNGGKAKEKCQNSIVVYSSKGEYGPVEALQLLFFHIIVDYLFFKIRNLENQNNYLIR